MSPLVQSFTDAASLATVAIDLGVIGLIFLLIFKPRSEIIKTIGRYAVWLGFIFSATSIAVSIFYSTVAGFVPCTLCWWQRIFLYPQAIIFAVSLWKRDKNPADYILALSIPGALTAAYHTYLQFGGSPLLPCSANAVSCAQRYFLEFGYVTIPTMSLTVFAVIILLMLVKKQSDAAGK